MDRDEKEDLVEMLVKNSLFYNIGEVGIDDASDPEDSLYSDREPISKLKYNYSLQRLIVEYFDYDSMKVTVSDLQKSVMTALMDLASDPNVIDELSDRSTDEDLEDIDLSPIDSQLPVEETVEEDGLVEVFSSKVGQIKEDFGKAETREYTIWFPWHVHLDDNPTEFKMYGHKFEPADRSEWRPRLKQIAKGPDTTGGGYILKEIEEGDYDIWKTTISSRTPRWAMLRFKNALEILSAQLNHSTYFMEYQTRANRLGRISGDTSNAGRWIAIQRPFGVFYVDDCVDENSYTPHWGANVYHRGGRPEVSLDYSSISDRFERHLPFEDLKVDQEPLLHNILVDYQQGLTETDHRRSFINFWRIIEELSLAGRGQKEVTVERALFSLELVTNGDYDPVIDRVANELWEVRNTRTHETGWIRIGTEHEIVAKILADAMIEAYLTEFLETDGSLDKSKIRRVFKWGTKPEITRKETQEALNIVKELFSE